MAKSRMFPNIFRRFAPVQKSEPRQPVSIDPQTNNIAKSDSAEPIGAQKSLLDGGGDTAVLETQTALIETSTIEAVHPPVSEDQAREDALPQSTFEVKAAPDTEVVSKALHPEPVLAVELTKSQPAETIDTQAEEDVTPINSVPARVITPKAGDFKSIASSWNVRQCEQTVARIYGQLMSVIQNDPVLSEKIADGFMKSIELRKDIRTSTLFTTAFRSGLKLRVTKSGEQGCDADISISSVSQLSSFMSAVIDGEQMKAIVKATSIAKPTIARTADAPGATVFSTVVRIVEAAGYDLNLESA